jgi:hypothetical protein
MASMAEQVEIAKSEGRKAGAKAVAKIREAAGSPAAQIVGCTAGASVVGLADGWGVGDIDLGDRSFSIPAALGLVAALAMPKNPLARSMGQGAWAGGVALFMSREVERMLDEPAA